MTDTVRIIAPFNYFADVMLKGRRVPRRVQMTGLTEYDIATAESEETRPAAVRVRARHDYERMHEFSYLGYGGMLWVPVLSPGGSDAPFTLEDYKRSAERDPHGCNIKFDAFQPLVLDDRYREIHQDKRLRDLARDVLESGFDGTPLWSNRSEALVGHAKAAERLLLVDGNFYERAFEPVWEVWPGTPFNEDRSVQLKAQVSNVEGYRFRLDRLDDALAYARAQNPGLTPGAEGEVLEMDAAFLSRDDVSGAVAQFAALAAEGWRKHLQDLPAKAVAAWHVLANTPKTKWADAAHDLPSRLEAIATLRREASSDGLPVALRGELEGTLEPIARRLEFEYSKGYSLGVVRDFADDSALRAIVAG